MSQESIRHGIEQLQKRSHATAVEHGWWEDGERNMGEMIALMHSELSEALESHRNSEPVLWFKHANIPGADALVVYELNDQPDYNGELGKPEGIASEFADVLIRIADTCERLEIPLAEALIRKMAYNDTRPYRHGGKAC